MGDWTDPETEDALAMRPFLDDWFEPIATALHDGSDVPPVAGSAFQTALHVHRLNGPGPDTPWGWKNPRNMWLIPFFAEFFPGLKFIHLIRDGRDMALSNNHYLLTRHGDVLLREDWRSNPVGAQLKLWEKGNTFARESAERFLDKDHYLLVRYEDFCLNPFGTIQTIFAFAGAANAQALAAECSKLVIPSKRVGSWKTAAQPEVHDLPPDVYAALAAFGYSKRGDEQSLAVTC